jgi:hypothetical protein
MIDYVIVMQRGKYRKVLSKTMRMIVKLLVSICSRIVDVDLTTLETYEIPIKNSLSFKNKPVY